MLVSCVQQSDSVIHCTHETNLYWKHIHIYIYIIYPFFFKKFSHIGYHRTLNSSLCYMVGPYWLSILCVCEFVYWRRQWHPTLVLLPGKSHGWRSLVGCSPGRLRVGHNLSNFTFTFHFHALEKEMATHSSVLDWRIPGTGEPDELPSMGSHRVGHDWSDLAAAAVFVYAQSCPTLCDPVDCILPGSSGCGIFQGSNESPFPSPGDL